MPEAQGAEILTSGKYFGRECTAGEIITAKEIDSLAPNVKGALVRQGNIRLLGADKSKKTPLPASVRKTAKAVAEAQAVVKSAENDVGTVRARIEAAEKRVQELIEGRRPFSLAAAKGDQDAQAKLIELRELQIRAELEIDDFREALSQAQAVLENAKAALGNSEFAAKVAELKRAVNERIKFAKEIDELVDKLELAIGAFTTCRNRIASLVNAKTGHALYLTWPLESRMAVATGTWVEPVKSESKASLAAFEERVLGMMVERFEGSGPCRSNGASPTSDEN